MQRDSWIALEVKRFDCPWHRPDSQLAILELDLRAADPWRSIASQGGHGAVFSDTETLANCGYELRFGLFDLAPARHSHYSFLLTLPSVVDGLTPLLDRASHGKSSLVSADARRQLAAVQELVGGAAFWQIDRVHSLDRRPSVNTAMSAEFLRDRLPRYSGWTTTEVAGTKVEVAGSM